MADDYESRRRAAARGQRIRAVLLAKLREDGPASAATLAKFMPPEVSLTEVAFQLGRLAEVGTVAGEPGGEYRALEH